MSMHDEINAAINQVRALQTTFICAPQRYDEIEKYLLSQPELDGTWDLHSSEILADDPTKILCVAPGESNGFLQEPGPRMHEEDGWRYSARSWLYPAGAEPYEIRLS